MVVVVSCHSLPHLLFCLLLVCLSVCPCMFESPSQPRSPARLCWLCCTLFGWRRLVLSRRKDYEAVSTPQVLPAGINRAAHMCDAVPGSRRRDGVQADQPAACHHHLPLRGCCGCCCGCYLPLAQGKAEGRPGEGSAAACLQPETKACVLWPVTLLHTHVRTCTHTHARTCTYSRVGLFLCNCTTGRCWSCFSGHCSLVFLLEHHRNLLFFPPSNLSWHSFTANHACVRACVLLLFSFRRDFTLLPPPHLFFVFFMVFVAAVVCTLYKQAHTHKHTHKHTHTHTCFHCK